MNNNPLPQRVPIPPLIAEGMIGSRLDANTTPDRVVVVRLHAFGDAAITLPLLAGLRRRLPDAHIAVVTSLPNRELFGSLGSIDEVWTLPTAGTSKLSRLVSIARLASRLGRIDLLLDLQRSRPSLLLRRLVRSRAWVTFDRFAPRSALDRYLDAAQWVGLGAIVPEYQVSICSESRRRADDMLESNIYDGRPLVCLNPAGCWETKGWPVENYLALARRMVREWEARIVLLGTENVREGASALARELGEDAIDLVGRTSTADALAIVGRLRLMVSDDSGLMHLAWVSGVPTLSLFGASRRVWSAPQGTHTFCYGSEDLECGACMSPVCERGDLLCLRRVDVEEVFERCRGMIGEM